MLRRAFVITGLSLALLTGATGTSARLRQSGGSPQTFSLPGEQSAESPAVPGEVLPPGVRIELVRERARNSVTLAFAPDGTWFYTERTTGYVKIVEPNGAESNLFWSPALSQGERGLIGITLDPNYAANGYLYVYYTSAEDLAVTGLFDNRVVRHTIQNGADVSSTVMLKVPVQSNDLDLHNSGNLRFGPDGKLYVSIGDYLNAANGQNLNSLPGKIHRFNPSAPFSTPADNPFFANAGVAAKSIYAFGFRNPFDFDFDPVSGVLFAGENGVACDDEVNRVLPGYNYGWRVNYPTCDDFSPGGPDPAYNSLPPFIAWPYSAVATGVAFYRGSLIPEWKNDLFVCNWKDGSLNHFRLNAARTTINQHTLVTGAVCHLDVENSPDGQLYFIRNHQDDPVKEYRDIYRITRDPTVYASTFSPSPLAPTAGAPLTLTMRLAYYGLPATVYTVTASLPPSTTLIAGSPQAASGAISGSGAGITWTGAISANTTLTATYRVTVSDQIVSPTLLPSTMLITTGVTSPTQRTAIAIANGHAIYLPTMLLAYMP